MFDTALLQNSLTSPSSAPLSLMEQRSSADPFAKCFDLKWMIRIFCIRVCIGQSALGVFYTRLKRHKHLGEKKEMRTFSLFRVSIVLRCQSTFHARQTVRFLLHELELASLLRIRLCVCCARERGARHLFRSLRLVSVQIVCSRLSASILTACCWNTLLQRPARSVLLSCRRIHYQSWYQYLRAAVKRTQQELGRHDEHACCEPHQRELVWTMSAKSLSQPF